MGKGLDGTKDRTEIPIAFSIARLVLRSVTIVLYQRGFFFHLFLCSESL